MMHDKFVEKEAKNNCSYKELQTRSFVRACRFYNRGLLCKKKMMKQVSSGVPQDSQELHEVFDLMTNSFKQSQELVKSSFF